MSIRGALGGVMSAMLALGGLFDNGVGAVIHWFPLTCILGTFPEEGSTVIVRFGSTLFGMRKGAYRKEGSSET